MARMLSVWEDASAGNPIPTVPAERPDARIDFVVVRPPGAWRVKYSEVHSEPIASDHRPLRVELVARG